jgi:type VI protein secretion system component VasK
MGRNSKPVGTLSYDCSDEGLQLALYTLPTGGELVQEPKLFSGPWAWHRLLEKHEFETGSSTYIVRQAVNVKGENVTMEIRLRFFKKLDCSGSPLAVFVAVP